MNNVSIFDKNIKFVNKKSKKINGIGAVTYYFVRLTTTSMIPIEITAVEMGDKLYCFSPQLNEYRLREDEKRAYYKNSIELDKEGILQELSKLKNIEVENKTADVFKDLFGVDIRGIRDYQGLVFDRIIYTTDFRIKGSDVVSDGYIFVFTDIASRRAKVGFFAGNLRNMRYSEYVDMLNEYGASNILNNITVEQAGHKTVIKNNTPFYVIIQPYSTYYKKTPLKFGVIEYERVKEPTEQIILRAGESFELHNEDVVFEAKYTLLDNKIAQGYINTPFKTTDEVYQDQQKYIRSKPYEFEIKKVGLEPVVNESIEDFYVITAFDTIDKLDEVGYSVMHKDNGATFTKKTEFGSFTIDTSKLTYYVSPEGMKELLIKGFANSMLLTIDSKQYGLDYSFKGTDTIITEIAMKTVFNNVTSTYMQVLSIKTATFADYKEFEMQNTKVKYEPVVSDVKYGALPYLMKSDIFKNDMVLIDMQEISDMTNRPSFGEYIFKTYDKELDDVVEEYIDKRKQALHNFKFIDMPLEVSSSQLAELSPNSEIWRIGGDEANDFAYRVKSHLSDLGYEIALEEALKKLKKAAYIFEPVKNVIATTHFGVSLDHEWFFFGSNWYRADEVMNPKITTYLDGVIKEYNLDTTKDKFMYVKKVFFGYDNDTNEEIVYARALAECFGAGVPLPRDLQAQNPALTYVMSHLLDNNRVYPEFREVTTYPSEFVNKYVDKETKNRYAFPNIFAKSLNGKYYPGIYSSARESELKRYLLNKSLDVLNSIVTMKIQTSAFLSFDSEVLLRLSDLFRASGYKILGIEDTSVKFDAYVYFKFNFAKDIFINNKTYSYGMEIYLNKERVFGLYYDIHSKDTYMFLKDTTVVLDYGFMIAMFDALLLYNVDEIDGYKYISPGVYMNPVLKDKVEPKYLYVPTQIPVIKGANDITQANTLMIGYEKTYIEEAELEVIGYESANIYLDYYSDGKVWVYVYEDGNKIAQIWNGLDGYITKNNSRASVEYLGDYEIDGVKYYKQRLSIKNIKKGSKVKVIIKHERAKGYIILDSFFIEPANPDEKDVNKISLESDYTLAGIVINYINRAIFVDCIRQRESYINYELGEDASVKISAKIDYLNNEMIIKKDKSEYRIPLITLANLPTKTMVYNGFVIKPYKVSKFLPAKFVGKYIDRIVFRFNGGNGDIYENIAYGEAKWVDLDNQISYLFALCEDGLVYAVKTKNHMSDFKTLYSLDDLFSGTFKKDLEIDVEVIELKGGIQ